MHRRASMVFSVRRLQHVAWAALLASGSVAGVPSVAFAKDTEAASGTDGEAEALIERGITYRRNGEDAEALPLFQRAEQLALESTRVKVHLAATYQALGQWEA